MGRSGPKKVLFVEPPSESDFGDDAMPEPLIAPKSDRLGELLRLYSELSAERKGRAFDFITSLHALEHEGGATASRRLTGANGRNGAATRRRRATASPPAPPLTSPLHERPRPLGVVRPQPWPAPAPARAVHGSGPSAATPMGGAELRVTLTDEQLRRLGETIAGPGMGARDPLDGLVATVFTPQPPLQPPPPAHLLPPPPANGEHWPPPPSLPPPPHTHSPASPLRHIMSKPLQSSSVGTGGADSESIYSMLGSPPPPPMGGGIASYAIPAPPRSHPASMSPSQPRGSAFEPPTARPPMRLGTPPPFVHDGRGAWGGASSASPYASVPGLHEAHEETRNLHDHLNEQAMLQQRQEAHVAQAAMMLSSPSRGGGPAPSPGRSPGRAPFMRSLTSMHQSMSDAEATLAQRKRDEWLRDLGNQVRARDEQRSVERARQHEEEKHDELQSRQLQVAAGRALRSELERAARK